MGWSKQGQFTQEINSARLRDQTQAVEILSDWKSYANIMPSRFLKINTEWVGEKLRQITLQGGDKYEVFTL